MKYFLMIYAVIINSVCFSIASHPDSYEMLCMAISRSSLTDVKNYLEKNGNKEIIEYQAEVMRLAKVVQKSNKQSLIVDFSRFKKRGLALLPLPAFVAGMMCGFVTLGIGINYGVSPNQFPLDLCIKVGGAFSLGMICCMSLEKYLYNKSKHFRSNKKKFFDSCEIQRLLLKQLEIKPHEVSV